MDNNRKFWREFLDLYRRLPALWNVKTNDYKNRSLKALCYQKLVKKMREVNPQADRQTVVKKINNFRTNYRRYIRRYNEHKRGGNRDAVVPSLWYFDMLAFLENQEPSSLIVEKIDEDLDADQEEEEDENDDMESEHYIEKYIPLPSPSPPASIKKKDIIKKEKKEKKLAKVECVQMPSDEDEKLMKLPYEHLRNNNDDDRLTKTSNDQFLSNNNSDSDIVARSWALQYDEMDRTQKMIARKIISDVLFYGCMGQLEVTHTLEIQQLLALPLSTLNSS